MKKEVEMCTVTAETSVSALNVMLVSVDAVRRTCSEVVSAKVFSCLRKPQSVQAWRTNNGTVLMMQSSSSTAFTGKC